MANPTAALFTKAGLTARDVRHIVVNVFPHAAVDGGGQVTQSWKAYAGTHNGDLHTGLPTDYIFLSFDPDWEFIEFELGGKTWPGLAVYPDTSAYTVQFADESHRAVKLMTQCESFLTSRYHLVLRHRTTGAIAICDPETNTQNGTGNDAP